MASTLNARLQTVRTTTRAISPLRNRTMACSNCAWSGRLRQRFHRDAVSLDGLGVRRSCRPPTVTPPAAQPSTRAARCARRAMRGFLFASPLNLMFSVEMKQPPLYGAPKLRDPLGRPGGVGLHDGLLISAEPAFRSSVCTKLNRCGTVAVFSFFLHGVRTEPDAGDLRRR